jgi:hypothetical protein
MLFAWTGAKHGQQAASLQQRGQIDRLDFQYLSTAKARTLAPGSKTSSFE